VAGKKQGEGDSNDKWEDAIVEAKGYDEAVSKFVEENPDFTEDVSVRKATVKMIL
jgi:hypothetical protein